MILKNISTEEADEFHDSQNVCAKTLPKHLKKNFLWILYVFQI